MSYSTEDCKAFLAQHYPQTDTKSWKRATKKKVGSDIVRTFIHPVMGEIMVIEREDGLHTDIQTFSVTQKKFSAQDEERAEKIILQYVYGRSFDKQGHEGSDNEELCRDTAQIKSHPYLAQGFQALPACFTFYFPKGCYNNDNRAYKQGIDIPMQSNQESFNVIFEDRSKSDPDRGANFLLTEGILPEWVSFVDEYHLELNSNAPDITVFQFFKLLVELGFEYTPGYMGCSFNDELSQISVE